MVSTPAAQRTAGAVPTDPDEKTIVHVLNRLGFGPVPGQVDSVRELGLKAYIDQQLAPERIADSAMAGRLAEFTTLRMSPRELAEKYYLPAMADRRAQQRNADAMAKPTGTDMMAGEKPAPERPDRPGQGPQGPRLVMAELTQQKLLRAAYSERQLEEVMVDFWFNHFNVFAGKGPTRMYVAEYEQNAIRPHALGKFRDILGEVAQSPAMLFYLDNWQSAAPESAQNMAPPRRRPGKFARPGQPARPMPPNRPKGINENYARELMELHTLGVEGGYTQKDVQENARAFTGWT
ncbi:MAG TPA: DUF1800 family protein, partial [Vicinamibacterales bacterium]|nr:DUF1800 family protein [Vicinamibacterales bacterium]